MVEQSMHVTDPAMLRAFAHPLRQRIVWQLAVRNHARAADLAKWLGEPANSLSFHLRTLAKAGVIVEAPEQARDARDRVWALANQEGYSFDPGGPAADLYVAQQLAWVRAMLEETLPKDPNSLRGLYNSAALLTRAEAQKMFEEVAAVLERWRAHGANEVEKNPGDPTRTFHNIMAMVGNLLPDDADAASSASSADSSSAEASTSTSTDEPEPRPTA